MRTNWGARAPCGGTVSQREAPKAPRPSSGKNVRYPALPIGHIYRNQNVYYTVRAAGASSVVLNSGCLVAPSAPLNLRSSILPFELVDMVGCAIFEMSSRSSYNSPGAISPATRHLAKIEFGHEILRGARRHFELPCYQAGG